MDQPVSRAIDTVEEIRPIANGPIRWAPSRAAAPVAWPVPRLLAALGWGARGRCPACGRTPLFSGFLRVIDQCAQCHAPLGQMRADDAPPYFVIFIVAHVIIGTQLLLEQYESLGMLSEGAILLPLTVLLSVGLLRPVKGATLGWMLRMGLVKQDDAG